MRRWSFKQETTRIISIQTLDNFFTSTICVAPVLKAVFHLQKRASSPTASTISFNKATADLLEKTVEQKRSFRSLSLMMNKIKGQVAELKKFSEEVRQQPHQSTASSILNRQTTLITRLNELELQVDRLDNDGQLSQYSSRIRDGVSMITARRNLSRQLTPAPPSDDKERIQHQSDIEEKQTGSNIFNQLPPKPPRPRQPSLFLQTPNEPGLQFQHALEAHQRNPKKEVHESLLKSKNKLENQTNAPNLFPILTTIPARNSHLQQN